MGRAAPSWATRPSVGDLGSEGLGVAAGVVPVCGAGLAVGAVEVSDAVADDLVALSGTDLV